MAKKQYQWEITNKTEVETIEKIFDVLMLNRGIKTAKEKEEFINPRHPSTFSLEELKIDEKEVKKAVDRIKIAIEKDEHILVYGDYDADGVCSTGILWQTLYTYTKQVKPFMPDRFIDGYGLHAKSIQNLKSQIPNLKLIITVDNGIVANDAVNAANELGIDVIISDHHQIGKKLPKAYAIVHTDSICGSGVAWILSREILKNQTTNYELQTTDFLDLAAIGTIADQMPLIGANRSFAKYGLLCLNKTKRCGLLALFKNAAIQPGNVGTYEVNFQIVPRINAMGRLENAMDSLRLLCTTDNTKAKELAANLDRINGDRQKMVEEIIRHAKENAAKTEWQGAIVLAHESYHEGVIGLVASKLVEEYYRPAIVLSKKQDISKASARSIKGFNIIENIRKLDHLLSGGGGHPMAAGFSIKTDNIEAFIKEMEDISTGILTEEMLKRKLHIDLALSFNLISMDLIHSLVSAMPFGIGNPSPLFITSGVSVIDALLIGADKNHIKMKLEKDDRIFEAIAFHMSDLYDQITESGEIDVVYSVEENIWNGRSTIQLRVKDMKISTI